MFFSKDKSIFQAVLIYEGCRNPEKKGAIVYILIFKIQYSKVNVHQKNMCFSIPSLDRKSPWKNMLPVFQNLSGQSGYHQTF